MAIVHFQGSPMHTLGTLPPVGSQATDFTVTKTDLSEIKLKNYLGNKIILNIFPSLDTETCAAAMRQFNEIGKDIKNVLILCISADLPFAQKRFCAVEHVNNVIPVSVFRHPKFGEEYGVLITDGPLAGLLSRAVIIINEQGQIIYTQQVDEMIHEPDYVAVTAALGIQPHIANLAEILSEWQNNLTFREEFKKNPEQALKNAGFTVSADDLSKIKAMLTLDKSKNEKLDDRISK